MTQNSESVLYSKILGSLANLAIGDALGYPAHEMSRQEIEKRFKGPLNSFHPPFHDNPYHTHDMLAGQITDDTTFTVVMAKAVLQADRKMDAAYFGKRIAEWARENPTWETNPMYGPTTKSCLQRLIEGEDPVTVGTSGSKSTQGATNGAAMRVTPAGLVNPGDIGAAVELAVEMSLPTHGTQTAISGAAAIAGGIAEALRTDSSVFSIASASIEGARQGERIGRKVARIVPAPDIALRIETGIVAALKAPDIYEASRLIGASVGSGMLTYETVPAAIALFVSAGGDPEQTVFGGANIGGDTDTIASIAGALAGAFRGIERVSQELYREVELVNGLDLGRIAEGLVRKCRNS